MFCPRCGCLLPDNASVCKECGLHLSKEVRSGLQEEQPSRSGRREKTTAEAFRYQAIGWGGTAFSILIAVSYFLPWLVSGSTQYSGLDLLTDDLYLGYSAAVLIYIPVICIITGVLAAVLFMTGRRYRNLTFALGVIEMGLTVIFCVGLSGYTAGFGVYLCGFSGLCVAVTAAFDTGRFV
ncbi:MAG: hypothetical protein WC132_06585 [Methanomethylophilus sp.]